MQVKSNPVSFLFFGLWLCACASMSCTSTSRGVHTVDFKTTPRVRLTLPGHVRESDLLDGFPTVRAEAPAGARGSLVLFGDEDGDLEPGAGERVLRFQMAPVEGGLWLSDVRITRPEFESLGAHKAYLVEVVTPDGTPCRTANSIDRP